MDIDRPRQIRLLPSSTRLFKENDANGEMLNTPIEDERWDHTLIVT